MNQLDKPSKAIQDNTPEKLSPQFSSEHSNNGEGEAMAPPEPEKKKLVFPPARDQCDPKASVSSIQVLKSKYSSCNSKLQQYIIKKEI